ncbi:hypothetical protein VTO42DRAFT_4207 [Malbranchea cinnamomea]
MSSTKEHTGIRRYLEPRGGVGGGKGDAPVKANFSGKGIVVHVAGKVQMRLKSQGNGEKLRVEGCTSPEHKQNTFPLRQKTVIEQEDNVSQQHMYASVLEEGRAKKIVFKHETCRNAAGRHFEEKIYTISGGISEESGAKLRREIEDGRDGVDGIGF